MQVTFGKSLWSSLTSVILRQHVCAERCNNYVLFYFGCAFASPMVLCSTVQARSVSFRSYRRPEEGGRRGAGQRLGLPYTGIRLGLTPQLVFHVLADRVQRNPQKHFKKHSTSALAEDRNNHPQQRRGYGPPGSHRPSDENAML